MINGRLSRLWRKCRDWARAAVVFGTAGERWLSDPSFTPIWDEFASAKLPL